jgi:hypothetical protein
MRRKLTFANVTAMLALFFALTAGSYAAMKLPANSVTTKQVMDHTLLAKDFKARQLPRGAVGPAGPAGLAGPMGPQGLQGPPGPTNTSAITVASGPDVPVCATGDVSGCDVATSTAICPAGSKVVSGGMFEFTGGTEGHFQGPSDDRTAWIVGVANGSSFAGGDVQATALCASSGAAVTASTRKLTATTRRDVRRVVARLRKLK